jgi:DNA polymerase-1
MSLTSGRRIFLVADLSIAEDRVERVLSRDPEAIRIAQTKPWEYDAHRAAAAQILGIAEAAVTPHQRFIGKRGGFAAQRGVGADRMQGELLKDGYTYTVDECAHIIAAYKAKNPWIEGAYFPDIRKQILRYRALASSRGAIMYFDYERLDEETYRRGYSFLPQREVADQINEQGFAPLDDAIVAGRWDARINLQVHDELLISCWPADAYDIAAFLRAQLERPLFLAGTALVIPVTFKVGSTWAAEYAWPRLPSRTEMTEAAYACAARRAQLVDAA